MANQAEKNRKKAAAAKKQIYSGVVYGVNVRLPQAFYLFFKFFYYYEEASFTTLLSFAFFSLVTYLTYGGIQRSLDLGVGYEYYLDVFIINITVQFLTVFSVYCWLIYLAIPMYLGSYLVQFFGAWARNSGAPEEVIEEPAKGRRREKVNYLKGR